MKRLLSFIPNVLVVSVFAAIVLAVLRPDLVPFGALRGDQADRSEPQSEGLIAPVAEELVDDGWQEARPSAAGTGPRRLRVVRLSSPEAAVRIGLRTAPIETRRIIDRVEGNAETAFDQHDFAEVVPRVACLVREVRADHGMHCEPGDVLAVVDSAEVGMAKAAYLSARASAELAQTTYDRTSSLASRDALPRRDEIDARANLNKAKADLLGATQRLRNLGFTDLDLERIAEQEDTSSLLDVVAPIAGTVVEFHAVRGEALEPTTVMFQITDLTVLWAWIDVPEAEFGRVRPGQSVEFRTSEGPEGAASGVVEWVDAAVNPVTRTVRVLANLANPDLRLRANQFGWGAIEVGEPREAVVVPREAVQGFAPGVGLVFLVRPDGSYRPQRVETRPLPDPEMVEVTWGLEPGGEVVTTGSFLLMTELRSDELAGD